MTAPLLLLDRSCHDRVDAGSAARARVILAARWDIRAGVALAVPFVTKHPDHADVLRELGAIAAASPGGVALFRAAVTDLLRAALATTRAC